MVEAFLEDILAYVETFLLEDIPTYEVVASLVGSLAYEVVASLVGSLAYVVALRLEDSLACVEIMAFSLPYNMLNLKEEDMDNLVAIASHARPLQRQHVQRQPLHAQPPQSDDSCYYHPLHFLVVS